MMKDSERKLTYQELESLLELSKLENQSLILKNSQLLDNIIKLSLLVEKLKRMQFGRKSEKYRDPDGLLTPLFNDLFDSESEIKDAEEDVLPNNEPAKTEKPKRKSPLTKKQQAENNPNIEILEVIIGVDDKSKISLDGTKKFLIGYEEKSYFHKIPAQMLLINQKREIWGSPKGEPGEMVTAPAPPHILPKSGLSPALASRYCCEQGV